VPEDTDLPPSDPTGPQPPPSSPAPGGPLPDPPTGQRRPTGTTPAQEPRPGTERQALAQDLAEVQRGRPERAFNVGVLLGVLLAVAAIVFIVQNAQSTEFDWLWLDFELPLWTALVGAMAVGVILVVVVFAVHERRQRRISRRQDAASRLRRAIGPEAEPQKRSRTGVFRRSSRGRPRPSRA
jgi:uncharacterized integral membrane protein